MSACREKGEELRAAVEEWQTKREVPEPRLTTGFLDGVVPIVDSYELKVTASHERCCPMHLLGHEGGQGVGAQQTPTVHHSA